ncbi:hypothetical protein T484DRAFT_1851778, partial [Baffinella frigidus]
GAWARGPTVCCAALVGDLGARAHLELRGRITAVDATMTKMREQMEWLDEEMSRLEAEKNELAQRLAEHTAAAGDQELIGA